MRNNETSLLETAHALYSNFTTWKVYRDNNNLVVRVVRHLQILHTIWTFQRHNSSTNKLTTIYDFNVLYVPWLHFSTLYTDVMMMIPFISIYKIQNNNRTKNVGAGIGIGSLYSQTPNNHQLQWLNA